MPAEEAEPLAELFAHVLDGRNATSPTACSEHSAATPRDFADYARDTAATGVWDR